MRLALLSTSDTDLLSARASGADWLLANPSRLDTDTIGELVAGCELVVVRILGTVRSWQAGFDALADTGLPLVVLGGEQTPDAELMEQSTVPVGTAAQSHAYLAQGGPDNLRELHAFLAGTVLMLSLIHI